MEVGKEANAARHAAEFGLGRFSREKQGARIARAEQPIGNDFKQMLMHDGQRLAAQLTSRNGLARRRELTQRLQRAVQRREACPQLWHRRCGFP